MAAFEQGIDGSGFAANLGPSNAGANAPFVEIARVQAQRGTDVPARRWVIYLTIATVSSSGVIPGPNTQDTPVSLRVRIRWGTWQGSHVMDLQPRAVGQCLSIVGQNVLVEVQNRDATVTYRVTVTIAPGEPQSELETAEATVGAASTLDVTIPQLAAAVRFSGFDSGVTATFLHVGGGAISEAIDTTTGAFWPIVRAAVTVRLTNANAAPRTGAVQFEVIR